MEYHYLYQIVSLVPDENGVCKIYSGIRKSKKPPEQDKYFGSGIRLNEAVKHHGRDKFIKTIVATFPTRKEAYDCETQWLEKLFYKFYGGCWTTFKKFHYNLRLNEDSNDGGSVSDETRQKMRDSNTPEVRRKKRECQLGEKNLNYGKPLPEELKLKISEQTSGEKNHFYGKKHTDESKTKIVRKKMLGIYVGRNRDTSKIICFDSCGAMKEQGFNKSHICQCIAGRYPHHKNFTFTRTTDEDYLRQLLAEDNFHDEQSKTAIQNFLQ